MMKKLIILVFLTSILPFCPAAGQSVTRTQHRSAVATDVVTTGSLTIRKPDYICISTNQGKEILMMDGTRFTFSTGSKKHITDSRTNPQFATFHEVLLSVIGGKAIPTNNEVSVATRHGQRTIVVTPSAKKRRQMFSSFTLVIDVNTSALKTLRLNERKGNYIHYDFK